MFDIVKLPAIYKATPTCPKCESKQDMEIKVMCDGKWCWFCNKCTRPMTFEEYGVGNP